MSTEQQRPPLWKILREAYGCSTAPSGNSDDWTERDGFSAEIRALRDWLVPEEPPPHRGMRPGGTNLTYQETLSVERQRLRTLLTTEAERAEAEAEDENGSMALAAIADAHALPLPQGEVEG